MLLMTVLNGLGELALARLKGKLLQETMLKCVSKAFKVLSTLAEYVRFLIKENRDIPRHAQLPEVRGGGGTEITKTRTEERGVGKEGRPRGGRYH